MPSQISYRGLVTITSPDPSGAGGLMMQNNFKSLTDALVITSGSVNTKFNSLSGYVTSVFLNPTQLGAVSGYLNTRIDQASGSLYKRIDVVSGYLFSQLATGAVTQTQLNNVSGYFQSVIGAGSVTQGQLATVSGYLDARDLAISGYFNNKLATYTTLAQTSTLSGFLYGRIDTVSGYLASNAGGGITLSQLNGVSGYIVTTSGYLSGRIDTVSGYLASNGGISLSQLLGVSGYIITTSGYLQKRDTDISGYLVSLGTTSFDTITNASNVSGYLAGRIISTSGFLYGRIDTVSGYLQGQLTGGAVTLTQLNNVSGYLLSRDASISGYFENKGYVVGPASATDKGIARYDDTTGKLIQNSSATITDNSLINANGFIEHPIRLTDNANIATDASSGCFYRVTLYGNRTLSNPTNPTDGQKIIWELENTGSRTISFDTKFDSGPFDVTLSTTSGSIDYLGVLYNSTLDKFKVVGFIPHEGTISGGIGDAIAVSGYAVARDAAISGFLYSRIDTVSGYLQSQITGGGVTLSQLNNVSGYLAGRIITTSGYAKDIYANKFAPNTFSGIQTFNNLSRFGSGNDCVIFGDPTTSATTTISQDGLSLTFTNNNNAGNRYSFNGPLQPDVTSAGTDESSMGVSEGMFYYDTDSQTMRLQIHDTSWVSLDYNVGSRLTSISGIAVFGPASSTNKGVPRFNGTTGKLIQNSNVTITDNGIVDLKGRIEDVYPLTNSSGIYTNAGSGSFFTITLYQNSTLLNPVSATDGQIIRWELVNTGANILTLDTKFENGPFNITLSTTSGHRDYLGVIYNSTRDKFRVVAFIAEDASPTSDSGASIAVSGYLMGKLNNASGYLDTKFNNYYTTGQIDGLSGYIVSVSGYANGRYNTITNTSNVSGYLENLYRSMATNVAYRSLSVLP